MLIGFGTVLDSLKRISDNIFAPFFPSLQINTELITDGRGGARPVSIGEEIKEYKHDGSMISEEIISKILADQRVAILNPMLLKIGITNKNEKYGIEVEQIVIELQEYTQDIPKLYHSSYIYTGSAPMEYLEYSVELSPDRKVYHALQTVETTDSKIPQKQDGTTKRIYHHFDPMKSDFIALNFRAKESGFYKFKIKIQYSFNGKKYEEAVNRTFSFLSNESTLSTQYLQLLSKESYTVQLDAFKNKENACNLALNMGVKGYPAFVDHPENSVYWFTRIGTFETFKQASNYKLINLSRSNDHSFVRKRNPERIFCP
jgi:hypothetical protein